MINNNPFMYGYYRNRKFSDVYPTVDSFIADYTDCGIEPTLVNENNQTLTNLYYMLYSKYGNSTIASSDENQFRYGLWTIVFMYGPTWEKRLELQKKIRNLTLEEAKAATANINNFAEHPNTNPSTKSLDELPYISQQTAMRTKRGDLEALAAQYGQLMTDVTERFLGEFKKLFLKVVYPEVPGWYIDYPEED